MANKTLSKCPACGWPMNAEYSGQNAVCAYCGEKVEAIAGGISIPTPVAIGLLSFLGGMFLGPAIIASTSEGKKWLEEQARGMIRR